MQMVGNKKTLPTLRSQVIKRVSIQVKFAIAIRRTGENEEFCKSLLKNGIYDMPTIQQLLQSQTMKSCYALVYSPNRQRSRNRFPENCVFQMDSEPEAKTAAQPEKNLYPALVCGPSKSSEGLMLYYLVQWLE